MTSKKRHSSNSLLLLKDSIYRLKSLFRQGWIGNIPSSDIESVADHSYAVATLGLLLTPVENALRTDKTDKLNELLVLRLALLHDLGESQYLDIDKHMMSVLGKEAKTIKKNLEYQAAINLRNQLNSFTKQVFQKANVLLGEQIHTNLLQLIDQTSLEAKFVRFLDKLELNVQCQLYLHKGFISANEANSFLQDSYNILVSSKSEFRIIPHLINEKFVISEVN